MADVKNSDIRLHASLFDFDEQGGFTQSPKRSVKCPRPRAPLKFKVKLIKEIEACRSIWDKNSRYKNKILIAYDWLKVAEILKVPVDYCKRQWKTLIKAYRTYLNEGKEMPEEIISAMQFMRSQITFYKARVQSYDFSRGDDIRDKQKDEQISSPIEIVDLVYSDDEQDNVTDGDKITKDKNDSRAKKDTDEIILCNSLLIHILNDSLRSNTVKHFQVKLVEFLLETKPNLRDILKNVLANPRLNCNDFVDNIPWDKFGIPKDIGNAIVSYVVANQPKKHNNTPTKPLRNKFQFQD